jgi:hypothetical protein
MSKFPEPPAIAVLAKIPPRLTTLRAGSKWWRLYFAAGPHPTRWNGFRGWGPTSCRFDHQLPPSRAQARRILYGADCPQTCLAECFQETRTIARGRRGATLVGFELTREVSLLDLTGTWPTQAGASMAINSGARARARKWSAAIYRAYPGVEGLLYCSSMNANQPAIALYERAADAVPRLPTFHRKLDDRGLDRVVANAAVRLKYDVAP